MYRCISIAFHLFRNRMFLGGIIFFLLFRSISIIHNEPRRWSLIRTTSEGKFVDLETGLTNTGPILFYTVHSIVTIAEFWSELGW